MIRLANESDAQRIADIYNPYILNTTVTFEEQPVTAEEMLSRMRPKIAQNRWFVYEVDGVIAGYAYAGPYASRSAWRFALEASVYIDDSYRGMGIGSKLYQHLLPILKSQGVHTVLGLIALPNPASVKLHENFGFKKAGVVAEGGRKLGRWIDIGYWQLMF